MALLTSIKMVANAGVVQMQPIQDGATRLRYSMVVSNLTSIFRSGGG